MRETRRRVLIQPHRKDLEVGVLGDLNFYFPLHFSFLKEEMVLALREQASGFRPIRVPLRFFRTDRLVRQRDLDPTIFYEGRGNFQRDQLAFSRIEHFDFLPLEHANGHLTYAVRIIHDP